MKAQAVHALKSPKAAGIAGVLFAGLLLASLVLMLQTVQVAPTDPGVWLVQDTWRVSLAMNLIPFAGVSFLWFVGVLRDRLGPAEDRLFATVFLGSGLLFVAMLFVSAAITGAILITQGLNPSGFAATDAFRLARSLTFTTTSVYAVKMAAVFTFTASTLIYRTGVTARWAAIAGYASGLLLLFVTPSLPWILFLFPVWVLIVSANILVEAFGAGAKPPRGH
jgi:hypothetical protein